MERISKGMEQLEMGHPTSGAPPSPRCTRRYMYHPIEEPNQIRTLKLHATKERIECSLQQTKVLEGGYQALSYVWGTPEKPFRAFVLDEYGEELGYIPLTENLENALCSLRDAEEVKTKVFWIDQVCIDQEGEEKNGQVNMMGDIYRNAERVITYGGPAAADEDEEKRGVELLNRLHAHFTPNHDFIFRADGMRSAWSQKRNLPVVSLPEDLLDKASYNEANYATFGWRWLLHVAFGEWTRRLWIVQEQCLNKDVVMLHGMTLLSWDAVATLPLLFGLELLPMPYAELYERRNLSDSDLTLVEIVRSVYHMWHTRKLQKQTQSSRPVHDLLSNMALHHSLQCWDLRDRIYALLAISKDADVLGIIPDYSALPRQVFLEASVRILQSFSNLTPLAYAVRWARITDESEKLPISASKDMSTLPSWALGPSPRSEPISITFEICKPHPRLTVNNRPSNFRLNQSVLVLKGRVLDSIAMSTPAVLVLRLSIFEGDITSLTRYSRIMLHWRRVLLYLGMTSRNVAGLCRVIAGTPRWAPMRRKGKSANESATFEFVSTCRCWVRNHNLHEFPVSPEVEAMLKQCTAFLEELLVTFSNETPGAGGFDTARPLTPEELEATNNLLSPALIQGRAFCVTESGRVCNAMHEPKKGDLVAAFQGADRLFILRSVGERFRLAGEAYVDGWMEGEAYEGLDPDEVDYDIELV